MVHIGETCVSSSGLQYAYYSRLCKCVNTIKQATIDQLMTRSQIVTSLRRDKVINCKDN